ncbi:MAG: GlsB/YeaQ/YmgE family stress response membrane protein [Lachnospiraceae bacterium]|nr:GlsB/YeaQ/YmgE family stress response membrane protein [Lachnospiraceae bacterium]
MWSLIITVLVGALCGWLASYIMKSEGSLLWYIIMGVIGGVVGNIVFGLFGIGANNIIGRVLVGVVGTCIVIAVYRLITGKK